MKFPHTFFVRSIYRLQSQEHYCQISASCDGENFIIFAIIIYNFRPPLIRHVPTNWLPMLEGWSQELVTLLSQVKPYTWLISYAVQASLCFSEVRKSFNSIWYEVVVLFRAAATAETKRQDWLCMRVQPTGREICGSGLL